MSNEDCFMGSESSNIHRMSQGIVAQGTVQQSLLFPGYLKLLKKMVENFLEHG